MSIFNVITLFGGLAMFLYGMRLMSTALKESSTGTLKTIMGKITDNVIKSFLLGVVVTAIIQSSTATIVITSGLVAANIITFKQSLGIALGANIGTTITGQIIRLMDLNGSSSVWLQFFKPTTLAPLALIIGIIFIMFLNFAKSDSIGTICMGFGVLFTGLMNMTNGVSVLNEAGVFNPLFEHLADSPILGYGIGALVAFILQSSSASVGILQAFSISGQLYFKSIYSVILGIYLGDCSTTAIVCSIGAKAEAKKVGIFNVFYNLFKTVFVIVMVFVLNQLHLIDNIYNAVANSSLIANANTIFNIACAIVALPIINYLEKLTNSVIKSDVVEANNYENELASLDTKFYATPALAFNSAFNVLLTMFNIAKTNIEYSYDLIKKYDEKTIELVQKGEDDLDILTDKVNNYLVGLSSKISDSEHIGILTQYYTMASEIERLGDHGLNLSEYSLQLKNNDIQLSLSALEELRVLKQLTDSIIKYAYNSFEKRDQELAFHIEPLEEVMDDLVSVLKDNHMDRLQKGTCNVYTGTIFLNILSDLERISDICSNIGIATIKRVSPDLASEEHDYASSLHEGHNETYNIEYNKYHDFYFELLGKALKGEENEKSN